jgi:hypothetical protein
MPIGQINMNSDFGKNIAALSQISETVVEIGTWNGCGSTRCVIAGMEANLLCDKSFTSIELVKEMYDQAVVNVGKNSYTKLLNGTIIKPKDLDWFDVDEHLASCKKIEREHFELYYKKEVQAINNAENVLGQLPEQIDLLILDGGEYSTYPEWQILKSRTSVVALDDTHLLKTKRIQEEMINDPEWSMFWQSDSRNGCSIWRKK